MQEEQADPVVRLILLVLVLWALCGFNLNVLWIYPLSMVVAPGLSSQDFRLCVAVQTVT